MASSLFEFLKNFTNWVLWALPPIYSGNSKELLEICSSHNVPIWEVMLQYEIQMSNKTREEIWDILAQRLQSDFWRYSSHYR